MGIDSITISFSLFLTATLIIVTVVIAHVRQQDKITRILALADVNHAIHANPEDSGIGTKTTNILITGFREVVEDFKESNREVLRDVKTSMEHISKNTMENTIAIKGLTMMIDHQNRSV